MKKQLVALNGTPTPSLISSESNRTCPQGVSAILLFAQFDRNCEPAVRSVECRHFHRAHNSDLHRAQAFDTIARQYGTLCATVPGIKRIGLDEAAWSGVFIFQCIVQNELRRAMRICDTISCDYFKVNARIQVSKKSGKYQKAASAG
jgi:hypothetical protein